MLSQPSDVSDLVPSRLVLIILAKSHVFRRTTYCLSQAYSCSDRYTNDSHLKDHGIMQSNSRLMQLMPFPARYTT